MPDALEGQLQQAMSLKSPPRPVGPRSKDRRHRSHSLASIVEPRLVSALVCWHARAQQTMWLICHSRIYSPASLT